MFYQTVVFSNSDLFTETHAFSETSNFTCSDPFEKTQSFSNSFYFSESNHFSLSSIFSETSFFTLTKAFQKQVLSLKAEYSQKVIIFQVNLSQRVKKLVLPIFFFNNWQSSKKICPFPNIISMSYNEKGEFTAFYLQAQVQQFMLLHICIHLDCLL